MGGDQMEATVSRDPHYCPVRGVGAPLETPGSCGGGSRVHGPGSGGSWGGSWSQESGLSWLVIFLPLQASFWLKSGCCCDEVRASRRPREAAGPCAANRASPAPLGEEGEHGQRPARPHAAGARDSLTTLSGSHGCFCASHC